MSRVVISIVGLAAAGLVGALAAVLVLKDHAAPAETSAAPAADGALVADLLEKVDRLDRRIEVLEKTAMKAAPPPAAIRPTDDVPDLAENAPASITPETLDARVKEAMQKERTEQMEAMGQRFAARAAQWEKGMIGRVAEQAGLSSYQQEELAKLLEKRREAVGSYFRNMFAPGRQDSGRQDSGRQSQDSGSPPDMTKMREEMEAAGKEAEEEIKALLTPEQYEVLQKEQRSAFGGWGGGGRGGGWGGGMGGTNTGESGGGR
jgi:hypothetical protein